MHAYFITRGVKKFVEEFIDDLKGKWVPYKGVAGTATEITQYNMKIGVRPIQLWEVVFPEEHKDIVLTTIFGNDAGKTQHKKHEKFLWAIRKALGAEPMPEYKKDILMPVQKEHMEVAAIGIKKDYWIDSKTGKHHKTKINEDCYEGI